MKLQPKKTFVSTMATLMAWALMGVSSASRAADFDLDPAAAWNGYINAFELDGVTYATGFPDATADLRANFAAGLFLPLTLAPNTRLYDTVVNDPFWVQANGSPNKIIEANFYQEVDGLDGQTITFSFNVQDNTLPAGYASQAFIKVLDAAGGWATVQSTFVDLTAGPGYLTLDEMGIAADPRVQAGFFVKGVAVSASDPAALTGVTIVPEPSGVILACLGAAALLLFRRQR